MTAELAPGAVCPTCNRKVPHVHDGPPTKKQERFTVLVPVGEEGALEELLVQWMERVQAVWPEEIGDLGDKGWRYRALHAGLYALSTAPADVLARLLPSEEGA